MKKVFLLILVLSACSPLVKPLPTAISMESPTFTPTSTETSTPTPTNTPIQTPSLEPISGGWSTFHSTDYGFSFQYPAVYDEGFYKLDPQDICDFQVGEDWEENFAVWVGIVRITVKNVEQNLDEFSAAYVKDISLHWDISSINQIFLDGVPARQLEFLHKTKSRWGVKTYAIQDGHLYLFEYYEAPFSNCSPPDIEYSDYWVYEQIINTWKFDD